MIIATNITHPLRLVIGMLWSASMFNTAYSQETIVNGDIEYGQYLASECVTCHSAVGRDKGIPPITNWETQSFISVVNAYKSKELENPAMQIVASRLDDEQIASLALYFASLPMDEQGVTK